MDFRVPIANVAAVDAGLEKLQKKALKLGTSFPNVEKGPIVTEESSGIWVKQYQVYHVLADASVALEGYEFVGAVDHMQNEAGEHVNLLRISPQFIGDIPHAYRTDGPTCDHCNLSRRRNQTFIVRDMVANELRRVGRQCLQDFVGENSAKSLLEAERMVHGIHILFGDYSESTGCDGISIVTYLRRVACLTRVSGFRSRREARERQIRATADIAWEGILSPDRQQEWQETPADQELAVEALQWARQIPVDTDSDYLHNVHAACSKGWVGVKECGIAASAISAYLREKPKPVASNNSEYVGSAGSAFGRKGGLPAIAATITRRSSFVGQYGPSTVVAFQDTAGNDLLWFATGTLGSEVAVGASVLLAGTIKGHQIDARTGRKTTLLTRVQIKVRES